MNGIEVAKKLKKAKSTIYAWQKSRGLGEDVTTDELLLWCGKNITEDITEVEARKQKYIADTELRNIEIAERKRELIQVDEAVVIWARLTDAMKRQFLALPVKLAPIVAAESNIQNCKQILETEISNVLSELSTNITSRPN